MVLNIIIWKYSASSQQNVKNWKSAFEIKNFSKARILFFILILIRGLKMKYEIIIEIYAVNSVTVSHRIDFTAYELQKDWKNKN